MKGATHRLGQLGATALWVAAAWLGCVSRDTQAHEGTHERIEALSLAIAREPREAAFLLRRAELRRQHRDWLSAAADLDAAARLDATLLGLDLARARLAIDRGEDSKAREWLDRHLAARPDSAQAFTLRAELLERSGLHAEAARDHQSSLRASTEPRIEQFLAWGNALARGGDVDGAVAALDAGRARFGSVVSLEHPAVEMLVSAQRWDAALARLHDMLQRMRSKEALLTRRGEILHVAGRADEAQVAFGEAAAAWEQLPSHTRVKPAMLELRRRIDMGMASAATSGIVVR